MDVVVVAGGRARRFGADKVLVDRDGRRQVDVVVAAVAALGGSVVVASGARPLALPGTIEVTDDPVLEGPLAGVVAGLRAVTAANRDADGALVAVVAADLVAPSIPLLQACARHARSVGARGAMPMAAGRPQPLHAVIDPRVAVDLRRAATANANRLVATMAAVGVVAVAESTWRPWAPAATPAMDIDTPGDLDRARRLTGP